MKIVNKIVSDKYQINIIRIDTLSSFETFSSLFSNRPMTKRERIIGLFRDFQWRHQGPML
jgi:hypothetical protein